MLLINAVAVLNRCLWAFFVIVGQATGISLLARVEVYLCLLDGSSKRRLRVTCPEVERCPPECILLGAGANEVCLGRRMYMWVHWNAVRVRGGGVP